MMYDPKYRNDKLVQELLKGNVLDQILYAFDPANFRQIPQPLPLYDPNPTGQGGSQGGSGAGGGSYLEQLLAGTQQAQAAAVAPSQVVAPTIEELRKKQPFNLMMEGGGMFDRSGYGGLGMSGY